jgi:hypothetical protein
MPGYIKAALHKYQHPAPARPEHTPHTWNPPIYGAKTQFGDDKTTSPALSGKDVNKLQQLTGTILYYAKAVDPTLKLCQSMFWHLNNQTPQKSQQTKSSNFSINATFIQKQK